MSNITSASGEASVSSGNTIAMADKERARQPPPNQFSTPSSADGAGNISTAQQNPVKKRKRNLPGNPGKLYIHFSIYPIRMACLFPTNFSIVWNYGL
jgi:hypothetical protein